MFHLVIMMRLPLSACICACALALALAHGVHLQCVCVCLDRKKKHAAPPPSHTPPSPPADAPYRNAALPIPARVADLLARMTTAEKVAQLWTRESDGALAADCAATGLGGTNVANARGATPALRVAERNRVQAACLRSRDIERGVELVLRPRGWVEHWPWAD